MIGALRLIWFAPDDYGGGVISVAQSCCRSAARAGYEATLLVLLLPSGHAAEFGNVKLETLGAQPNDPSSPAQFIVWLKANPQDVVFLNGCEQVDNALPFIPAGTRAIYVVHDTAARYFKAAIRHENSLDAIVAVSETVAARFRHRLKDPGKLSVIHNGSIFPIPCEVLKSVERANDLVFLGGDNLIKGATDVLSLWPYLLERGFDGRLHWYGAVRDKLRREILRLPMCDRILVHGRVGRRRIFETASRSKVCLMVSRVEPFGMATLECMAMGCGIAAWDIETGTKEIASQAGDANFAPLGDYRALADGVMRMLSMPDNERLALAQRVRDAFGEEAMWERYRTLVSHLMMKPAVVRSTAGQMPPPYTTPNRLFQILPAWLRASIRDCVGRSARLGHLLRDLRGY